MKEIEFPGKLHRKATEAVTGYFLQIENIDTILLVNSLARGKATADSDIDIAILVKPLTDDKTRMKIETDWQVFFNKDTHIRQYLNSGKYAQLHLDIIDGRFSPAAWEAGGTVDFFEVEIGNRLVYSRALTDEGEYFRQLKSAWLPYYNEMLQSERYKFAREACLYEIDHIPIFVERALFFHAFDRLYAAFQKFLQTIFIRHKTYPIAYNKWIKEQITGILQLPELYKELPGILSVNNIESSEISRKAENLRKLLDEYCN